MQSIITILSKNQTYIHLISFSTKINSEDALLPYSKDEFVVTLLPFVVLTQNSL